MLTVYEDMEQRSPEWFAARCGIVTASVVDDLVHERALTGIDYPCPDCGAECDAPCVSKVKRGGEVGAPIKTIHEARTAVARTIDAATVIEVADNEVSRKRIKYLAAERLTGFVDPSYVSSDMWRGIEHEPIAVAKYAENHAPVESCGFMTLQRDGWTLGYSPDGLVGDDGLLEVKCPRAPGQIQTVLTGEIPAHYMAQLQCGLFVSGRAWIDFLPFYGGLPLWTKRVTPDPRWQKAIVEAVEQAEKAITEITDKYLSAVVGLPETERVNNDLGLVF